MEGTLSPSELNGLGDDLRPTGREGVLRRQREGTSSLARTTGTRSLRLLGRRLG